MAEQNNPIEQRSNLAHLIGRMILNVPGLRVIPKVEKGKIIRDKEGLPIQETNLEDPTILDTIVENYKAAVVDPAKVGFNDRPKHVQFKALRDLRDALVRGEKKAWFEVVGGAIIVTFASALAAVEAKRDWKEAEELFKLIENHVPTQSHKK